MIIDRPDGTIAGFHFSQPLDELPALSHCGDEICSPQHRIHSHHHDRFEFCYVRQGRADWRMGSTLVHQEAGQLLVALPEQRHELLAPHDRYHILYAGIDLEQVGPSGRQLAQHLIRRRINLVPHALSTEAILSGIVHQVTARLPMCQTVVQSLLQTLVAMVSQLTFGGGSGGPASPARLHSYPVEVAMSLMRQRVDRPIPVAELADAVNYSPAHFARLFKNEVGLSPAAFHRNLRLQAARAELQQPGQNITQVALMFGFGSSQHFSHAFRRAFDKTPRQWRGEISGRG